MRIPASVRWLLLCTAALALATLAMVRPGGAVDGASSPASPNDGVVAYYFHTTFRCSTCRKLEALSREALKSGFSKELGSGTLTFRVVNVEDPGNEHFVKDFQLVTKSLVLVEYKDGKSVACLVSLSPAFSASSARSTLGWAAEKKEEPRAELTENAERSI